MKTLLVSILISILLTSGAAYKLHSWRVDSLRLEWQEEAAEKLDKQKTALTKTCEAEKAITKKVSHDYQNQIADLNFRIADAKRLLGNNACISVKGSAASGYDAAAASRKSVGSGASGTGYGTGKISAGAFIDLIGEGEKYRRQLLACQAFVTMTEAPKIDR